MQILDPMGSVAAVSRLVDDAVAGALLGEDGGVSALPGLPGHTAFGSSSGLVGAARSRIGECSPSSSSFLWPVAEQPSQHGLVRVTHFALSAASVSGVCGVLLLSPHPDLHGLTRRELEVLGHVLDGASNDRIARALVVTPRTVATHVEHILAKLSSPSRTHAAVRAQREGLYVPATPAPS